MGSMFFILITLLILYMLFLLALLAYSVVSYILSSLALFNIARDLGNKKPWLAWVPYASTWLIGKSADDAHERKTGEKSNYAKWALVLMIVYLIFPIVSIFLNMFTFFPIDEETQLLVSFLRLGLYFISLLAYIPYAVVTYICYYRIYKLCYPNQAVLFLLLSIFVSVTAPFLLFACRNKVPVLEDDATAFDDVAVEP